LSRHDRRLAAWKVLAAPFLVAMLAGTATAQGPPDGQLTVAFDASIASSFLDPAETAGIATPFVFLYALHDALIKPLPGNDMAPCLAESWRESPDGLVYEFKLREGLISLARPARPAGGEPRHRQAGHQRRGAAGLFPADRIDHPECHGVRPAHRAVSP
jgi:hypothetical protein